MPRSHQQAGQISLSKVGVLALRSKATEMLSSLSLGGVVLLVHIINSPTEQLWGYQPSLAPKPPSL